MHGNGARGDMADSFAFATFFPNVVQPPIAVICNTIFSVLVKVRLSCNLLSFQPTHL